MAVPEQYYTSWADSSPFRKYTDYQKRFSTLDSASTLEELNQALTDMGLDPVEDPPPSGGSYSAATSNTDLAYYQGLWYDWMGTHTIPANVLTTMRAEGWDEDRIRRHAATPGADGQPRGSGPLMLQAQDRVRQIAATYYDGDPSGIPQSLVNVIIHDGIYADETYLAETYFPKLHGAGLTNPLAQPYVDAWVELTGRPMTEGATAQLDQYIRAYGFTSVAEQAWLSWAKQTDDAITGNFGAEQRFGISQVITTILGRDATDDELAAGGSLWDKNDAARLEALRADPEYESIYAGKPAWMSEGDWVAQAQAMDAVMRWYYGDTITRNPDGSVTIGASAVDLPEGEPGEDGLGNFGIDYLTADMLALLTENGYSAEQLQREFAFMQDIEESAGRYDEMVAETFGAAFTQEEWYSLVSGGEGSGELKARLAEAQNRVGYREAYRRIFGDDPDPADYDRILSEYISPDELIREYQARFSVDEMYDEINDLLTRVYGDGVTKDELLGMALGQEGSGELKALINTATKLDEYTVYHKQYYGDPTPDDYAKYAGYVSPQELQWEIVATEAVVENMPDISEAWDVAFPDEPMLTEEELYGMYAGKEGYGELRWKVKEAQEKQAEAESAEDWAYRAERAEIAYAPAPGGGFKKAYGGLADQ